MLMATGTFAGHVKVSNFGAATKIWLDRCNQISKLQGKVRSSILEQHLQNHHNLKHLLVDFQTTRLSFKQVIQF